VMDLPDSGDGPARAGSRATRPGRAGGRRARPDMSSRRAGPSPPG
jgi:hypothetical protein